MITKRQDKTLEIVGVLLPIIFSFLIGMVLSAKLFNMEVSFALVDYVIIGIGLFSIFFGVREQLNNIKELRTNDRRKNQTN